MLNAREMIAGTVEFPGDGFEVQTFDFMVDSASALWHRLSVFRLTDDMLDAELNANLREVIEATFRLAEDGPTFHDGGNPFENVTYVFEFPCARIRMRKERML
jgi:hypothetical protein